MLDGDEDGKEYLFNFCIIQFENYVLLLINLLTTFIIATKGLVALGRIYVCFAKKKLSTSAVDECDWLVSPWQNFVRPYQASQKPPIFCQAILLHFFACFVPQNPPDYDNSRYNLRRQRLLICRSFARTEQVILLFMRCQNSPGCSFIRLILMLFIQSYFKMYILNIILIVSFWLIIYFQVLQSFCK